MLQKILGSECGALSFSTLSYTEEPGKGEKRMLTVREVDIPFLGEPKPLDEIPDSKMILLAGQNICCPGCHAQCFNQDPEFAEFINPCHTNLLVNEFKLRFPEMDAPKQLSLSTKDPEELKRVLITENAIFCGLCPPRAAPTTCVGYKISRTIFGNPKKLTDRVESKQKMLERAARVMAKSPNENTKLRLEKAVASVARAEKASQKAKDFVVDN